LKLAEQIKALGTVLDSFGNAKTLMNPNASRHGRYLELHFNERGRISAAKVLTFGLDKTRLNRLTHEERTYHVFYQFLAGTTTAERDHFNLEDVSDYALLASSGCYRLPSGPFSDDSIAMADLRAAMRTLGFKPKHMTSIFSLLVVILLLGNLQFADGDAHDVSAHVSNPHVLDQAARLLGVSPDELDQIFTNKTNYVRKELFTVLLNAEHSSRQRDQCVRDLYAILVAYVVETSNHRLATAKEDPPSPQIILFDQPGFQTRGPAGTVSISLSGTQPLISAYGQNGFDEFCINFADEMLQSYVLRQTFENSIGYNERMVQDAVTLPSISTMDNGACIQLLRGAQLSERSQRKPGGLLGVINKACSSYKSGRDGERRDEELLRDLTSKFTAHASFIADRNLFGINHYAGSASYDVAHFVEKDSDLLDSAFVSLLRNSSDGFVSKLLSGPSLAAERHSKDEQIIVQAQVSSRPLRNPSPVLSPENTLPAVQDEHPSLDPAKTYPVTTQLNFTLSEVFASLERTKLWTISCIRPNDSGSPNSFDKRRIKSQIRSLLLPDLTARKTTEYIADYDLIEFCERYVPTMRGSEQERIVQCARANGWKEGEDYVCGSRNIWLSYEAWKTVEDILRNAEKGSKPGLNDEEDEEGDRDDNTDYTHQTDGGLIPPSTGYFADSADNLLLTRTGNDGTPYQSPNLHYDSGGLQSAGVYSPKEGGDMVVKEAPNVVVEVPSTKTRRFWLWLVWLTTWWIPNFMLRIVGRMKRPDIRLAWREKVTIFFLIFLFNALVIFYIVEFGRLLCPNFDKAWGSNEVAQHQGSNDYWVSVRGIVYDLSNFVNGDHSNGFFVPSNSPDVLEALAGLDLSYYFPPALTAACSGLVTDTTLSLTYKNFTDLEPVAIHLSGALQTTVPDMENANWYTDTFLAKMKTMQKGPLVLTSQTLAAQAADTSIAK
jgi:chitin synthase